MSECTCEVCTVVHPMFDKLRKALEGKTEELEMLEQIYIRMATAEDEAAYWEAKFNGDWTGMEWMKGVHKKRKEWEALPEGKRKHVEPWSEPWFTAEDGVDQALNDCLSVRADHLHTHLRGHRP